MIVTGLHTAITLVSIFYRERSRWVNRGPLSELSLFAVIPPSG